MYQFFVKDGQVAEHEVFIEGSDVNHIRNVLRMKAGDEVRVTNESGKNWRCAITELSEQLVHAQIVEEMSATELPCKVYLFQGLPKNDKMELIIQKAVELGVYQVIPVAMKRCVVKLDDKKAASKITRWQGIAEAAAKQSKRGIIPQITKVMTFAQALEYSSTAQVRLVPYELAEGMDRTREIIEQIQPGQDVAVFIGPEGGFDEDEIGKAIEAGMQPITLGKRILRTETAGMTVLSILMYHLE